ncbi:MAG TPA: FG-GAP-like repeat-containing protein [Pyrinomonadaceae bacterium]|nr:FG-GAP-like repeat-containing protein [Pyrinomonadaceae bacterium]
MSKRSRRAVVFVLSLVFVSAPSWRSGGTAPQTNAAASREEAYRANNLGVALLEQFKHAEGAEAFRRALKLDPRLALARINLAIALLYVPDAASARREALAAAALAPEAPQPHYVLGLLSKSENKPEEALAAFQRVLKIDPRDVGANVQVGQIYAQQRKYPEAVAAFRAALAEEPYNGTALYNLGTALLRAGQREEGQRLVQQFQTLRQSGAATTIGQNYLEQGRYAEAVSSTGAEADLVNKATPDVVFGDATESFLPGAKVSAPRAADSPLEGGESGDLLNGGVTLFDFDSDGDLDLFGPGKQLRRNDGGKFTDLTEQSGLVGKDSRFIVNAGVAGDYDNDGRPDLFLVGYEGLALYRNEGAGRFADVTAAARVPKYAYSSHSAAFVDADHDGDLDIFVAGYGDTSKASPPRNVKSNTSQWNSPPAPNLLLRNNGDGTFADVTTAAKLGGQLNRAGAVVPTDYDNRRDVDLLVVNADAPPALWRNLRDGTFRNVAAEVGLDLKGASCVAAGDVNKDGFTDFYFCSGATRDSGTFALSDGRGRFNLRPAPADGAASKARSNSQRDAQLLDYDNDGLLDLLVVTRSEEPSGAALRLWRNTGDGWADVSDKATRELSARFSAAASSPAYLATGDLDGDGDTDLVLADFLSARDAGAVTIARNEGGNRNASVRVRLAGKVSNRGGVGAKVEIRAGSLGHRAETYAATPAPAPADLVFGIGQRAGADAVRVLWPAGIVQTETEVGAKSAKSPTGPSALAVTTTVTELDRKPSSCPYLYTWNGERFEFVTDFMGGGELGYWAAPGVRSVPDPEEFVRIRGDQLKEREGRFELRVTNELEEALFIDALKLIAVSHPQGVEVYPNEGLGNPTSGTFKLYATRDARPPAAARDEHGHDVLPKISLLDRQYPDDFKLSKIRGYAEEHALVLDLGGEGKGKKGNGGKGQGETANRTSRNRLSPLPSSSPRTLLLMTGWTDYAFSSDNVAASQRGLSLKPPALQVRDERGEWRTVIEDIGVPVGRPQTVVVDLTGKFLSASREVRVLTNMRIYWDQVLVETSGGDSPFISKSLRPAVADLSWRGFSAETTPDGREPYGYDYERVSSTSPWKTPPGRYTRFGDVRELLRQVDDIFVVSRPGDELSLSFDASKLPPLPAGWTRTFLLYADGFSKEMDINSASPDQLAPLPFHGMKSYPYAAPESYPWTPARRAYAERYNTRLVASPLNALRVKGETTGQGEKGIE